MASFTTRVELHGATWDDYTRLHEKMRAAGFSTTIKSDDGKLYKLPPAEYRYEGNVNVVFVRDRARAVASSVKAGNAVFVTEGSVCAWIGLELANAYA